MTNRILNWIHAADQLVADVMKANGRVVKGGQLLGAAQKSRTDSLLYTSIQHAVAIYKLHLSSKKTLKAYVSKLCGISGLRDRTVGRYHDIGCMAAAYPAMQHMKTAKGFTWSELTECSSALLRLMKRHKTYRHMFNAAADDDSADDA